MKHNKKAFMSKVDIYFIIALVIMVIALIYVTLNFEKEDYVDTSTVKKDSPSNKLCSFVKGEKDGVVRGERKRIELIRIPIKGQECPTGEHCVETDCILQIKTSDGVYTYSCDGICK